MIPPRGWVLDASVAMKLLVEEEGSEAALALLGERLVAPEILGAECANALWRVRRRGALSAEGAAHRLARLAGLVIETLPHATLLPGALARALRHDHPVYDCLYLEASAITGLPLVTADRRLAALTGEGAQVVLLGDLPAA